ncbi:bile acid:sodium symporter family protein [Limnobaculum xujianqingii]|uniref:bile acid:sodium symporter family protein n=1 Tax=Limnobaculum xujianqingii TaxID=2738837 RepID=UPI00112E5E4E|nr:bile acid:sodium symporter family protein [Limnobaculum xujianqingii]
MSWLKFLKVDTFLVMLIGVMILATLFPCEGDARVFFGYLTKAAIALLFFMHGAKLSRQNILNGIRHWRLHLIVFASTFVLFPLLGLSLSVFVPDLMSTGIYLGFLYLCALPATVQSAIAYTSIAGGNVAAAVCSASASSMLGVFISPILVGLLMHTQEGSQDTLQAILNIVIQLMLPFIIGHLSRPFIVNWIERYKKLINTTDRSSILLVVYTAFSDAVIGGIWHQVNQWSLLIIIIFSILLLAIVLIINTCLARWLGFSIQDEITIIFCGSKKSLANGIPMANVLFPAASVGMMVLPLMIFHQIQLMVCTFLAQRYAKKIAIIEEWNNK